LTHAHPALHLKHFRSRCFPQQGQPEYAEPFQNLPSTAALVNASLFTRRSFTSKALCEYQIPFPSRLNQTRNGRPVSLQRARQISSSEGAESSPSIRAPQCPQKFFRPVRSPPHFTQFFMRTVPNGTKRGPRARAWIDQGSPAALFRSVVAFRGLGKLCTGRYATMG
jgi:hypothetical protein